MNIAAWGPNEWFSALSIIGLFLTAYGYGLRVLFSIKFGQQETKTQIAAMRAEVQEVRSDCQDNHEQMAQGLGNHAQKFGAQEQRISTLELAFARQQSK